ncbi:murein DD-endopeptidase MepM/ murein hydrolase activator NlpD [Desulfobaculum xiamenense]|uniref:Murein DD-endopeptidase MepM/ murein hydrolase activator NlpD n=1 Tax=Desulfobaculum xiamenense TaxID=995050 RepID=A0A846QS69_9BACT|nr:M23 family metallopeptidase [Desulfobaculum xiamenense]NJB69382.1 murein DD-endopeptidase MepM/ murein hydrolase activator NlpD [Desulfobaculum xiamenense]
MNRRNFLALAPGVAAWCVAPGAAYAAASPAVDAVDSVGIGCAFFVRLASPVEAKAVRVSWLGETFSPVLRPEAAGYGTWVALAADLTTKPGRKALDVAFELPGGTRAVRRDVTVVTRKYPEQHLTVAKKMVHPAPKALERHKLEREAVQRVLARRSGERFWETPFVRPVPGGVSSDFGLRRVFNGEPRAPHRGVDLRGAAGSAINAFAAGEVALVADHYFSGNVVYIDHGQGMISMYCHMSAFGVREGQFVSAGQEIGKVGSTGRVTGPHLHFGLSVMGHMVDPMPLFEGAGVPNTQG